MKLAELFTEAQYQIAGPTQGTSLPLVSNAGDSTESSIDLKDRRIDLDNPNGPTLTRKKSEGEQKKIAGNMKPGQQFSVIPKLTGVAPELWFVVSASPAVVVATQDSDALNNFLSGAGPKPVTKNFPVSDYYIDNVNQGGLISFAQERGMGEKSRELNKLDRQNVPINVENVELEEGEKDACYRKVKSRYKIWPSAYASGALVKCRKVGAKNWGNKSKKK
jgi:hypothetical protein